MKADHVLGGFPIFLSPIFLFSFPAWASGTAGRVCRGSGLARLRRRAKGFNRKMGDRKMKADRVLGGFLIFLSPIFLFSFPAGASGTAG
ncbi:hypothetical protein Pla52o_42330 [Novipirellula galeiformis]|uniref:Uncharacterized protein n=1 Tax=Novipirellula galeiformis TaxID=2528004 RepID=A0A5C6CEG2_9BACT|nr:hypothetical protein Pla52o_42330 [Novipirellula galeiformis]